MQSASAQDYLRAKGLPTEDFDSLVFVPDWNRRDGTAPLLRSAGALAAVDEIGGGWRVLAWLRLIPAGWRDGAYKLVARSRHRLFGAGRPEILARPEWKDRFL